MANYEKMTLFEIQVSNGSHGKEMYETKGRQHCQGSGMECYQNKCERENAAFHKARKLPSSKRPQLNQTESSVPFHVKIS
jgi:hypothetical protein